jgi:predicted permease
MTLAIAIGANTAIFTLLNRVVLQPLPYPSADRLLALEHAAPGVGLASDLGVAAGLYREYGKLPSTESIALHTGGEVTLSGEGSAERLRTLLSSPTLNEVLGVLPLLGRWFTPEEGTPEGAQVALLTYGVWQSRFGGSPTAIGRLLRLDGTVYEVIGVMPADFAFPEPGVDLILPLQMRDDGQFGGFNFQGVVRLRPGVTVEEARRQQAGVIADLPTRFPDQAGQMQSLVGEVALATLAKPLKEQLLGSTERMLWVLLGSVGIVLIIACANLANLFLVRADGRRREVAVRRAVGAGTGNVGAYYLAETLLVAVTGGALGMLLAYAAVQFLGATNAVDLPRLHEVRIDATVVAYAGLVSLCAGILLGVMPLARRLPPLTALLRDAGHGGSGRGGMHARQLLMASQVGLAIVLLVAAGLMVKSVTRLAEVDPGFQADERLVFSIGLPSSEYPSNDEAAAFHDLLLERLKALPGVRQAAFTTRLPLDGDGEGDPLDVRGRPLGFDELGPVVRYRRGSSDYFAAMAIPLRQGRLLDDADADGRTQAVVIDQAVADIYFPGEQAVGRQIRKMAGSEDREWLTIVGVVGNTPTIALSEESSIGKVYLPPRSSIVSGVGSVHTASYVLHANGSPAALVPGVRRALEELNPGVALARAEPLSEGLDRSGARLSFVMLLLLLAALIALLLGTVGAYSVISYSVAQRRSEIGIRLALGADPRSVSGMIVRQSGTVIAGGVIVGVVAAAACARLLQALLFGVAWNDVPTYLAAATFLFGVALFACWVPAHRAASAAADPRSLFR